jgi:hypothetical protein
MAGYRYRVPDFRRVRESASAAVSAVVGLPHGLRAFVAVVRIVFVVLGRAQNDLAGAVAAWKGKRLQNHIESVARLVRERRAEIAREVREPVCGAAN